MPAGTHLSIAVKTILAFSYGLPVILLHFSIPVQIIPAGFHGSIIFIHIDPGILCHTAIFSGIVSTVNPYILRQISVFIQIIGNSLGSFPLIFYIRAIAVHIMGRTVLIDPAFFCCHNRNGNRCSDHRSHSQCPDPVFHPTFLISHIYPS